MSLRRVVWICCAAAIFLNVQMLYAQAYPNKPIRLITRGSGGSTDISARMVAQSISIPLGQPVIVENRGGNPTVTVVKATPDGYTLFFAGGTFVMEPLLRETGYDPVQDFLPVAAIAATPNVFVIHPSLAASSVQELIALVKAKPGEFNYASIGVGHSAHLGAELFKSMAGLNMVHIPYKSAGEALTDLVAGRTQFMVGTPAATAPYVKSGKLKILAVTSAKPSMLVPGVPTVAASGLAGYETAQTIAMYAPAKTPAEIIRRLNQEIERSINQSDIKQKLFDMGLETVGGSPERLAASNKAEVARMRKVIKDAGIKAD